MHACMLLTLIISNSDRKLAAWHTLRMISPVDLVNCMQVSTALYCVILTYCQLSHKVKDYSCIAINLSNFLHRCTGLTEGFNDEKVKFVQQLLTRSRSEEESGLILFEILGKRYSIVMNH